MPDVIKNRASKEAARWVSAIRARDVRCVFCGSADRLQAHHVMTWAEWPELRVMPGNGLLVCLRCHSSIHGGRLGE